MKASVNSLPLFAAILFLFSACQKEEVIPQPLFPQEENSNVVPATLQTYFQRFETAAQQRGLSINLAAQNITGEFQEIPEEGVAGSCTYGSHQPGQVVIDQTFWNLASDHLREMIVFHELGHCALFLDHREGTHADGTCASIMRSGLGACRDNYNRTTREEYLDELFEQK